MYILNQKCSFIISADLVWRMFLGSAAALRQLLIQPTAIRDYCSV